MIRNASSTARKSSWLSVPTRPRRQVRSIDRTWFAWIGGVDPGSVFYYRIHSPVILIEFDHQRPVGCAI